MRKNINNKKQRVMKGINVVLTMLFVLSIISVNKAQELGTFKAGLVFGANAAQVNGDALYGYNKLGFTAGARVTTEIKPLWDIGIELLYSQKGSRTAIGDLNVGAPETNIKLNYAEVPIFISFKENGIRINAGLSYNRLVGANLLIQSIDETDNRSPFYRKTDINIFGSGGYQINDHWMAEVRWGRSFLSIVQLSDVTPNRQYNVWLSFRGLYLF